ncbi:MAG: hypothetical protein R6V50_08350 [Thermoplasmatota archaeon]
MKSLLSFTMLIIAIVAITIIVSSATLYEGTQTTEKITEEDLQEMIETVYADVSSYMNIDDILGKFHRVQQDRLIKQIAIQLHPQFSTNIKLSELMIELSNGNQIIFLDHNGCCADISNETLFNHGLWDNLGNNSFGILSIFDDDNSMKQSHLINQHSDRLFIIFKIPHSLKLQRGDTIKINLYPSIGVKKELDIKIPFSVDPVLSLW